MERSDAFRILVVGDFSGGSNAAVPVAQRRIHRVDRDDFEELFGRLGVTAELEEVGETTQSVQLPEFDAMHPDQLFDRLAGFERLRSLRRRLGDPATFRAAAEELGATQSVDAPTDDQRLPADTAPSDLDAAGMLEAVLEATEAPERPADRGTGSEIVDAVLRELVVPHVTPAADPRLPELQAMVDRAASELMRRVLKQLRPLEARWSGLRFLVRRLEAGAELGLYVLDATTGELADALLAEGDPADCDLWKRLVDQGAGLAGGEPWSVIALADPIEQDDASAEWLGRLSALSRGAGGVLLCGAGPSFFVEQDSRGPVRISEAGDPSQVCLVGPRILLRMPYGERGNQVERFRFEEAVPPDDPEHCCWGSGVFAAVVALASGFATHGWALDSRQIVELEALPVWVYHLDGEAESMPCAERWITEREAEDLRNRGLSVLRSVRGRDSVRVGPLAALDGVPLSWPTGGA